MLGKAGANVGIACRNTKKGQEALRKLAVTSKGDLSLIKLDLADLSSVKEAAKEAKKRYKSLDGLINNAGIMQTPQIETADGFEMQLGTNHLGHFLWTGLFLILLKKLKAVWLPSAAWRINSARSILMISCSAKITMRPVPTAKANSRI